MCTAISITANSHYFGRNLDMEYTNDEHIIIIPRNYSFVYRDETIINKHYAMIGLGIVRENYPLYYDAANEHGLCMAGLNFPHFAVYHSIKMNYHNIAPFEIIPWILGQCKSVKEAKDLLNNTNVTQISFNKQYPLSPLHWIISDNEESITVEPLEDGLHISHNPVGVLTNSPDFQYHMQNLSNYMHLSIYDPKNNLNPALKLQTYSRGMGAIGLPGDLSSASRFIRAAFTTANAVRHIDERTQVSQFFHILQSVSQTEGCVIVDNKFEKTIYSSCCNASTGTYYYKTYHNHQIKAINMFRTDLDKRELMQYKMQWENQIIFDN